VWLDPDRIFEIRELGAIGWLVVVAAAVLFLIFLVTVAPRLRAVMRAWRRKEDELATRLAEYYGAAGGPSVVPRNLVPELCVIVYVYLGAMALVIFVSPVIPLCWFFLATMTLLVWRGRQAVRLIARLIARRQSDLDEAARYIAQQANGATERQPH